MSEQREDNTSRFEFLKVWGPLLVLVCIGFALAVSRLEPPPPKHFKIAAGSPGGAYFSFAERYREILTEEGYGLEVVQTSGSLDNLERLRRGEVDLALMQGGTGEASRVDGGEKAALQSLGSLFLEPLWIFHRAESPVVQLRDLKGQRLAIGPAKSGVDALSQELLLRNGIDGTQSAFVPIGGQEAAAALLAGQLDAAFFVTSAEASYIEELLRAQDVQLLSITRTLAYQTNFRYLSSVVLGEGALDLSANVPQRGVTLLATAASMVAREDLHHALIPLLLQATQAVHSSGGLFEEPGAFPSAQFSDFPVAVEAAHYLANGPSFLFEILPFRTAVAIDRLKILLLPFLTLLIPVFKAAPPLYRWRIRRKIFRWYEDLKLVDEILHCEEPSSAAVREQLASLRRLEREVTEVQVPLSYMDEFYRLRIHIALILAKLRRFDEQNPLQDLQGDA
jgi:TRAP transporter TAXI family solute receptor